MALHSKEELERVHAELQGLPLPLPRPSKKGGGGGGGGPETAPSELNKEERSSSEGGGEIAKVKDWGEASPASGHLVGSSVVDEPANKPPTPRANGIENSFDENIVGAEEEKIDEEVVPEGMTRAEYDQSIIAWAREYARRHQKERKMYEINEAKPEDKNSWYYQIFGGGGTWMYTGSFSEEEKKEKKVTFDLGREDDSYEEDKEGMKSQEEGQVSFIQILTSFFFLSKTCRRLRLFACLHRVRDPRVRLHPVCFTKTPELRN